MSLDSYRDRDIFFFQEDFPMLYDKVTAAASFMYATGFFFALGLAYFKLTGVLQEFPLPVASSSMVSLILRTTQLCLAVVSFALMANVLAEPGQDEDVSASYYYYFYYSDYSHYFDYDKPDVPIEETWEFNLAVSLQLFWYFIVPV